MKKITLTTILLLAINLLFAQDANIVVFSEGGESFTLIMNGIKYNETPQTNVKVTGLNEAPYKAKIIFEDRAMSPLDKTLYANKGLENTYNIKRKKKDNSLIIRLTSQTPVESASTVSNTTSSTTTNVAPVQTSNTQTTTTTTTTISNGNTGGSSTGGETISMNVNLDGFGMNVNINDNTGNSNTSINVNENSSYTYSETTTTTTTTGGSVSSGATTTSSNGRCDYPMDNSDFYDGKKSIESKTFADSKMTVAKQITKANCPTAEQVRDFTKLFTYESDKVEFAKFAYDYCYDKGNYYKVNDAFEFESSIDELNEHIGE